MGTRESGAAALKNGETWPALERRPGNAQRYALDCPQRSAVAGTAKGGPWQSVYARFAKWRDDGTLEAIF